MSRWQWMLGAGVVGGLLFAGGCGDDYEQPGLEEAQPGERTTIPPSDTVDRPTPRAAPAPAPPTTPGTTPPPGTTPRSGTTGDRDMESFPGGTGNTGGTTGGTGGASGTSGGSGSTGGIGGSGNSGSTGGSGTP